MFPAYGVSENMRSSARINLVIYFLRKVSNGGDLTIAIHKERAHAVHNHIIFYLLFICTVYKMNNLETRASFMRIIKPKLFALNPQTFLS